MKLHNGVVEFGTSNYLSIRDIVRIDTSNPRVQIYLRGTYPAEVDLITSETQELIKRWIHEMSQA